VSAAAASRPAPLVTVIVPTHNHATTIDLALDSVLAQSLRDVEVLVIADGPTDEVAAALERYPPDPRLRTIVRPKSPSRWEELRHELLLATPSTFVAYHGDDDLMLPDHLEHMVELLADADFAHAFPLRITDDGTAVWYATDLSLPECREWHQHPERNGISLTGVVHRVAAYRRLPFGWRAPPPGHWPDHYMWQQWFATPGFTYRCGERPTTLKFDAAWRQGMSPEARRAELLAWRDRAKAADFDAELAALSADAVQRFGISAQLELARASDEIARQAEVAQAVPDLLAEVDRLGHELAAVYVEIQKLTQDRDVVRAERDQARAERDLARDERDLVREERDQARAERDVARSECDQARTERDQARSERDRMAATRTWRLHDRVARFVPARARSPHPKRP
jgi:glycosyl transferase family 2